MKNILTQSFKISLPVLFGYLSLGIAFGIVLTDAGYPWYLSPIMSIFMYAGAAQFVAIGLFASGASLSIILLTEFFVNIRHIVYGLSLISKFSDCGKWKVYLIFSLTDETYSLLTSLEESENPRKKYLFVFISLLNHLYWITGSTIGALVGNILPFKLEGSDFALSALFAVLVIEQIKKHKDYSSVFIGMISTIIGIVFWKLNLFKDSSLILLIAISLGIVSIFIFRRKINND